MPKSKTKPTLKERDITAEQMHDGDVVLFTLKGKDFFGVARHVDLDYDETKVYVYFGHQISRTELPREHPVAIVGKLTYPAMFHLYNPIANLESGVLIAN